MCHIVSENQNNPAVELTAEEEQQNRSEILQIRRDKLSALQEEGKDPFQITTYARTAYADQIVEKFDEMEGRTVSIAGRIMSKRGMG